MTEHLLSTLGLALRAGAVAVGEEPVGAAARGKKARVIFTAQDAAPSSVRRAYSFGRAGSCLCLPFPAGKDALGRALGRSSVAMCAVTDIGFAQSLVAKLAALDPVTYAPALEILEVKARRARERREEQLRHEKNLRAGRRSHTAPPPPPHEIPGTPPPPPPRRDAPHGAPPRRQEARRGPGRPLRDVRSPRRDDPPRRFENALPVKKGKGSPRKPGGPGRGPHGGTGR